MTIDYLWEDGCCLDCEDSEPECLCFNCKCRSCSRYEFDYYLGKGYCTYAEHLRQVNAAKWRKIQVKISIIAETDRAYLLVNTRGEETWFPKSQVKIEQISRELFAEIPNWLLEEKNWRES